MVELLPRWYSRPVFFVADVNRAWRFYADMLSFKKDWHDDGAGTVCQVSRDECEIILCQDAVRADRGRLFVSLTVEGVAELRRELVDRKVPHDFTRWGYAVVRIQDPDGNELLVPLEA